MVLKSLPFRNKPLQSRFSPEKKVADPFYKSPEWMALRDFVLERDNHTCQWPKCRTPRGRVWVDHRVEIKDGGAPLDPDNAWCLCASHHTIKTNQERDKRMTIRY